MCFAFVKMLRLVFPNESSVPVFVCRTIFILAHLYMALASFMANKKLQKSRHLLLEEKVEKRAGIAVACRGLAIRVPIILAIHFKVGLLQPLVVSSALGLMKLLETECCCYMLTRPFTRKGK